MGAGASEWVVSSLQTEACDTVQANMGVDEPSRFSFLETKAGDTVQITMEGDEPCRFIFPWNRAMNHRASNHGSKRTAQALLPYTRSRWYGTNNHGRRRTLQVYLPLKQSHEPSCKQPWVQKNRWGSPCIYQRQVIRYKYPWKETNLAGLSSLAPEARDTVQAAHFAEASIGSHN
jgi:hypothetical protein